MDRRTFLRIMNRLVREGKILSLGKIRLPRKIPCERELWALPSVLTHQTDASTLNKLLSNEMSPDNINVNEIESFRSYLERIATQLDEVKKSPMVPPPCCIGCIAVICCGVICFAVAYVWVGPWAGETGGANII